MADTEMREPTFLILASLAGGRKHGYALIKEAEELSDGRVKLKVGTLYAALDRLEQQGAIGIDGDEVVDGRARRYYALSEGGRQLLETEVTRLERNAAQARVRLALGPARVAIVAAGGIR
jgi:PadR family transcriptional regulator PadR